MVQSLQVAAENLRANKQEPILDCYNFFGNSSRVQYSDLEGTRARLGMGRLESNPGVFAGLMLGVPVRERSEARRVRNAAPGKGREGRANTHSEQ